ncbi:MAG: hypothetical protein EBS01_04615, partial [Verrucomicrobia bacterium]|nr:hypothetical protein [Verrucomicrobiota bacterium]
MGAATGQDFAIARYNVDGSLDTSYGTGGRVTTSLSTGDDHIYSSALQADGKLVVAGDSFVSGTNYQVAIARYNTNGSLDTTFNGTGKILLAIETSSTAYGVAIQPDGNIVVAGQTYNGTYNHAFVARYTSAGALDTTFGAGTGKVVTSFASKNCTVYALALAGDGKIVTAGMSDYGTDWDFTTFRYNANGTLDTTFNATGWVITPITASKGDSAWAVTVQPDGKIVAAGYTDNGTDLDECVVRYNVNGSLDASFNGTGKNVFTFGSGLDRAQALLLQGDGKILVAGYSFVGTHVYTVARLNQDGYLDPTFGSGGKASAQVSNSGGAFGIVRRPDGRILLAGDCHNGTNFDFGAVQFDGGVQFSVQPQPLLAAFGSPVTLTAAASAYGQVDYQWRTSAQVSTFVGTPFQVGSLAGTGNSALFTRLEGLARDPSGNLYVADGGNHTICKITSAGVVTILAGSPGISGSSDATGTAARFNNPVGVAVDPSGTNLYVSEWGNQTIRKVVLSSGAVSTLAGGVGLAGTVDATGTAARFNAPHSMAVDASGNVYVSDWATHLIRKVTSAGAVTTIAGSAGVSGFADGAGTAARFFNPCGMAVDGSGNVYVADGGNGAIRKIVPATGVVTTEARGMGNVCGLVRDVSGIFYASSFSGCDIWKIPAGGLPSVIAGVPGAFGCVDGAGLYSKFGNPNGLALDGSGNLYAADVWSFTVRKIALPNDISGAIGQSFSPPTTASGFYEVVVGNGNSTATSNPARVVVQDPFISTQPVGGIFVSGGSVTLSVGATSAGSLSYQWQRSVAGGSVSTVAGTALSSGTTNAVGAAARFNAPYGIAVDAVGNAYVSDFVNHTIRKVAVDGTVSTFAGSPLSSGSLDGFRTSARFNNPYGLAFDTIGNLYVAENSNHAIRKITPSGLVTTVAGLKGTSGTVEGIGTAARFNTPQGIAPDLSGNLYVADSVNHVIRKISPTGVVTVFAGSLGAAGTSEGTGNSARFTNPVEVVLDGSGNLYVADFGNHAIRKVSPDGAVTNFAGLPGTLGSTNATGTLARFNHPTGLAFDASGNLYVADNDNALIRMVTPAGVVSTVAGVTTTTGSTDGAAALAKFNHPIRIAFAPDGSLMVADQSNFTIRKITFAAPVSGALGATYTKASASFVDAGTYSVLVSGSYGSVVSAGTLVAFPPIVTTQPIGARFTSGGAFSLSVAASGQGALSYQWRKDGVSIGGGTSATYAKASALVSDAGGYDVVVSDSATGLTATTTSVMLEAVVNGSDFVLNSGSFVIASSVNLGTLSTGTGTVVSVGSGITLGATSGLVSGKISGAGSFASLGNVILGGPNDFTGQTAVQSGTLAVDFLNSLTISAYNWSTFAGVSNSAGGTDGTGSGARFYNPYGIAVDAGGTLYVADLSYHIIRKVTPTGVVTTLAGYAGSAAYQDGTGSGARFFNP